MLTKAQSNVLLKLARKAIEEAFGHKTVNVPASLQRQKAFLQQPGVFVTIFKSGELRGSTGYPEGSYPIIDAVKRAARNAAFNDPRFKRLRRAELPDVKIRVDVLSKFKQAAIKDIRLGKDGVYIKYGPFKAIQLPEDARKFKWTAKEMVENALRKAGLASEMWKDRHLKVYTFIAQAFKEK